MSEKQALVIYKDEYQTFVKESNFDKLRSNCPTHGEGRFTTTVDSSFFWFKNKLVPRSLCETDPTLLQVIPYVILMTGCIADPATKLFVYMRGKGGAEGRLHGKCSIGLGGHIEEDPNHPSFYRPFMNSIVRELQEEVGIDLSMDRVVGSVEETMEVVYNETDDVGKVHLGFLVEMVVKPRDLGSHESGVITQGQWLTVAEIKGMAQQTNPIQLEEWAKIYLEARKYEIPDFPY